MQQHLNRDGIERLIAELQSGELIDEFFGFAMPGDTEAWTGFTVRSSGTTSAPKPVHHTRACLEAEVASWCALLPEAARVLSMIPPHHLYGLVWTVLWPGAMGIPVLDCRRWSPEDWWQNLCCGDVIVAVPVQWAQLVRTVGRFPSNITGVTSAGELSAATWKQTLEQGLLAMHEIYGSTETGGVASRSHHTQPLTLAPHWHGREDELASVLPDRIELIAPRQFVLAGRKDSCIKIAGHLVDLDFVRKCIIAMEGVEDCQVRSSGEGESIEIEALIVTAHLPAELRPAIQFALAERLPSVAVPRKLVFRKQAPRDGLGKITGW